MKLFENARSFITNRYIIPEILRYNDSAKVISYSRVTKGGYFCPAVMHKGIDFPFDWILPMHCSFIFIPENGTLITWYGFTVIEVTR